MSHTLTHQTLPRVLLIPGVQVAVVETAAMAAVRADVPVRGMDVMAVIVEPGVVMGVMVLMEVVVTVNSA